MHKLRADICFVSLCFKTEVKYERLTAEDAERKLQLADLPSKSLLTTHKLSETRPGLWTQTCVSERRARLVKEASECRAGGVRLQEQRASKEPPAPIFI